MARDWLLRDVWARLTTFGLNSAHVHNSVAYGWPHVGCYTKWVKLIWIWEIEIERYKRKNCDGLSKQSFFLRKIMFPTLLSWLLGWGRRKKKCSKTNVNIFLRSIYREFHTSLKLPLDILRATFLIADLWMWFLSSKPTSCRFRWDTNVRTGIKNRKYEHQRYPYTLPKRKGVLLIT